MTSLITYKMSNNTGINSKHHYEEYLLKMELEKTQMLENARMQILALIEMKKTENDTLNSNEIEIFNTNKINNK